MPVHFEDPNVPNPEDTIEESLYKIAHKLGVLIPDDATADEALRDLATAIYNGANLGDAMGVVVYDSGWATRPVGYTSVTWVGPAPQPSGMHVGDIWEEVSL